MQKELPNFTMHDVYEDLAMEYYMMQKDKSRTFVSCWRKDSNILFDKISEYTGGNSWACVESTLDRLRQCTSYFRHDIDVDAVEYVDFKAALWDPPETWRRAPVLFKDLSFEWEKEVRAITLLPQPKYRPKRRCLGIKVPVNLKTLIRTIYLSKGISNADLKWITWLARWRRIGNRLKLL